MLTTAIIAFREFLEAFLLIGIFLGVDKKFGMKKQKEILLASLIGIVISLALPLVVFFFASSVHFAFTEKNADILEGYLLTFSGFFLAYVIFSLHEFMKHGKKQTIHTLSKKMEQEMFDVSLFATIIFFIVREGFEVALLVATTSLFSVFWTNSAGLFIGFLGASLVGLAITFSYIKLPIQRIFSYTEYVIMLIGAAMIKNGISLLSENYLHLHLEKITGFSLPFLPSETTIFGHAVVNLTGLQKDISLIQLGIMAAYVLAVCYIFRSSKNSIPTIS